MKRLIWPVLATLILLITNSNTLQAQKTVITGRVLDAQTREGLVAATVQLLGVEKGTRTDVDGYFRIEIATGKPTGLKITYVGYIMQTLSIKAGEEQNVEILLRDSEQQLQEVTIKSGKYRNKNNPAVELMREAIDRKSKNRIESLDYYSFEKYEKVEFSLNNVTEKTKNSLLFRKFKFLFDNADTSAVNGKVSLLLYLHEGLSDVYFRNQPKSTKKEYIQGERNVMFKEITDVQGVNSYIQNLYQDIDFYDDKIDLLTMQFVSPLSPIAPNIYRFYIQDTSIINGTPCAHLYFAPRQKTDLAFIGDLWIALDSTYALRKIETSIPKDINLNWVKEMQINQEFRWMVSGNNRALMLSKDEIFMDFGLTKGDTTRSMLGRKMTSYQDYTVNQPLKDSLFATSLATIRSDKADTREKQYWESERHEDLTRTQIGLVNSIDSLQRRKSFIRAAKTMKFLVSGHTPVGLFEIGPANTFYSFNPIEGLRLRFGGRTGWNFSPKIMFEGFAAYGFKDQRWKGYAGLRYSLNSNKVRVYPLHQLRAYYHSDIRIPGQKLAYVSEDNFLLSFKRGSNTRMIRIQTAAVEYIKEFKTGLTINAWTRNIQQQGAGSILFDYDAPDGRKVLTNLSSTEVGGSVRYAPHEKFFQGATYRTPILTKYPVFEIRYTAGLGEKFMGDYPYHQLTFRAQKTNWTAPAGYGTIIVEAGRTFGQVPYPFMTIHRANQTYSYQIESYNLMNFLEFVSDKYVSVNYFHDFGGAFLGRVPLLEKTKWREVLTFKGLWGGVDARNQPDADNQLLRFPTNDQGQRMTYTLESVPYIEGSVGIANIFHMLRLDLVRRFTYLDHPEVSKYGVRARVRVEF